MLKRLFNGLLEFVIPPLCVSCENPLETYDEYLCSDCSEQLTLFNDIHPWTNACISNGIIDNSFSLYRFIKHTPIQHLLHSMKYEKMKSIGVKLGKEIAKNLPYGINFDYCTPVPLHIAKKRERTYNQSEFICRGMCKITGTITIYNLLKRIKFTKSQTRIHKTERIENVRGAFELNTKYIHTIRDKNIIVVDDVITTGATILECARVLKEAGAGNVFVCSAAYDALD